MPNGTGSSDDGNITSNQWQSNDLRPLLIYIHGGGLSGGSKDRVPDYVRQLAEAQRYVLASIEYRLTSQAEIYGSDEAVIWPAQREDCLDAVQFLSEKSAQFGANNKRMACTGTSAGGQLCSVTAAYGQKHSRTPTQGCGAAVWPNQSR